MGFDLEQLQAGSFGAHSQEEGLVFLQAWLFFGLLKEAFADKADIIYEYWIEDWGNPENIHKIMQSPHLTKYLDVIAERLSVRQGAERPPFEWWEAIFELTITVTEAFEKVFAVQSTNKSTEEPTSLRITWSILMLGQMLTTIVMKCYGIEDSNSKHWPDGILIHRRMAKRQWCPHLSNKLTALLSMDIIYLLTLMSWYNPISRYSNLPAEGITDRMLNFRRGRDDPAIGLGRHRRCTVAKCLGEKIDERSYTTEHVHESCSCDFTGPDVSEVIRILDDKEVPVFLVQQQMDTGGVLHVSVDVERSGLVSSYVAISHVWADGLGNKAENTLPTCQILRVAHLVHDLGGKDNPHFSGSTHSAFHKNSSRGKRHWPS